MAKRNFSLLEYFIKRSENISPKLHYAGGDVSEWQCSLREKILDLLDDFPKPVELNPEIVWAVERDGLIWEKIVYDSEEFASVPAILIRRQDLGPNKRHKAMLCLHGHGLEEDLHRFGKDPVTGVNVSDDHEKLIRMYRYNYAEQFARAGYVTITPDFRNFGERHDHGLYPNRDSCNVHFIRGLLMGTNLITLNIWDAVKTIDYLITRPDVDPNRIGCMGLSFGGTMALHIGALDNRIRAVSASCALTTYEEYAIKKGNFCGSQFIPGIYQFADLSDIAGLIAPRPLIIQNGIFDEGFPIEASLRAQEHLCTIYQSMSVTHLLAIDNFYGAHQFNKETVFPFFEKYL